MPSVMIRKSDTGVLLFYVAKKDMEETIAAVEQDSLEAWGGEVELTDGTTSGSLLESVAAGQIGRTP